MYKNPKLSPEVRAKDLLSKMTLEEKIQQLSLQQKLEEIFKKNDEIPCYCGEHGSDPSKYVIETMVNETRLGIPPIYTTEGLHGKATKFPQCAGLGCTFNREFIYDMGKSVGIDAKIKGQYQVFAPVVDIPRDPRWGRMQESYGEDPYLVGELGAQYVKGVQSMGVAATAKHFLAYGISEGGINTSPAHVGEREIREVYIEPFKKCIDAGVMSIMPSYNETDGEPMHGSKKYLRKILRDELGFDGTAIADWAGIELLNKQHHIAPDKITAAKFALNASVDIELPFPWGYSDELKKAVENGEIDIELIDEAVLRILKLKFKLGLFENPYGDEKLEPLSHSKEMVELSLNMDEQAILLLKNDGILPLNEENVGKVAVIGNNAKDSFLGDYTWPTSDCVSFYNGMVNRLGEENVLYAQGCGPILYTEEMISEAVEKAKIADTVFLVLGDRASEGGGAVGAEHGNREVTCSEGYDSHTLDFLPSQRRLFDEIIALGKPTVLIIYGGRPYAIGDDVEKTNAFMFSFGGGEQSGNAFANLIFGDKSPSAKLSFSFPRSAGHIPAYYNYKVSSRGAMYNNPGSIEKPAQEYIISSPDALYPFGFGLSYTEIEYSNLTAEVKNKEVKVTVDIENKGKYEIDESVLLFVKMLYCPVTPFIKKLRNFTKVNIKPGDKKTVEFTLTEEDFTYIDYDMKTAVNRGEHKIIIDKLECSVVI